MRASAAASAGLPPRTRTLEGDPNMTGIIAGPGAERSRDFRLTLPQAAFSRAPLAECAECAPVAGCRLVEEDVAGAQRPRQRQPFQRAAARQGHVRLAVGERAAPQVDVDLVQRKPLALVDGERPGQPQRKLAEGASHRFDDLLRRAVEGVAPAFPGCLLDLVLGAVHLDPDALLLQ